MMKMRAAEVNGMVWFDGTNVELAGVKEYSFLKVMRLMHEAKGLDENVVYTIDALEVMLHLNATDIVILELMDVGDDIEFGEQKVTKLSKNLYLAEELLIQYNTQTIHKSSDEKMVDDLLAEMELFNELIYGSKPTKHVETEELVNEEELLCN